MAAISTSLTSLTESLTNRGDHLWLARLMGRRNKNVAAVALANKNARTVWALLAHGRAYEADYEPAAA